MNAMVTMTGVSLPAPTGMLGDWLMKYMQARPMSEVKAERAAMEAQKVLQETIRQAEAAKPIVIDTRDLVTVRLYAKDTRDDVKYLKTYDRNGTERWFEKARCTGVTRQGESFLVEMPRAAVKARKMEYAIVELEQ